MLWRLSHLRSSVCWMGQISAISLEIYISPFNTFAGCSIKCSIKRCQYTSSIFTTPETHIHHTMFIAHPGFVLPPSFGFIYIINATKHHFIEMPFSFVGLHFWSSFLPWLPAFTWIIFLFFIFFTSEAFPLEVYVS